jgi:hypothetical protein
VGHGEAPKIGDEGAERTCIRELEIPRVKTAQESWGKSERGPRGGLSEGRMDSGRNKLKHELALARARCCARPQCTRDLLDSIEMMINESKPELEIICSCL